MATKIKPLRKFTTGTPTTSDMEAGEIAVNTADKKVFMRDNSNNIVEVGAASSLSLPIGGGTLSGDLTITGNINADGGEIHDFEFGSMGFSNITGLIHSSLATPSTQYSLLQSSIGKTYLNSASGNTLDFRIGNTTYAKVDVGTFNVQSSADGGPILNLISNDPGDVADFATEGGIFFKAENSASQSVEYANIKLLTDDVSDTTEDGRIRFNVAKAGTITDVFDITSTRIQIRQSLPLAWQNAGGSGIHTSLQVTTPSTSRTITLPDASGDVALTQSGVMSIAKIRLSATDDVSASSTLQALQIGPTNSFNIAMDNNEIMARNNGSVSNLKLNDGALEIGSSDVTVAGTLTSNTSGTDANSTSDLTGDFGTWIRIGDGVGAKTMSNGTGIKFHDAGVIHWSAGIQSGGNFAISKTHTNGGELFPSGKVDAITIDSSANVSFGNAVNIEDSTSGGILNIGDGDDLRLYHNGSNSVIVNDVGSLYIVNETADADITLQADDGTGSANTPYITLDGSEGEVDLNHYGNTKLTTKSTGVDITGTISSNATMNKYGSTSAPITFTVTVATQTAAHPYNGDGSTNKYSIDGVQGAALTLHGADDDTSNSEYIYRFDQSDSTNNGHPLRFYLQADKTNPYTTGVTTNGTPGQAGAYTQIAVTKSTPKTLFYQCSQHGYMGNYVTVANSTKFTADDVVGTDTVTATKLRLTSGANATGSATTHAFQIGASNSYNVRLDNNQIASYVNGTATLLYINPSGGQVAVGSGGLKIMGDGNDITFGTNNEIVLTHVHDTGLLLTDTGGSPTLQLHDSNESVSSDGTNLILTSGGTAFKMPTSDGTGGHFLKTDGSGNLSFAAASGGGSASDSFKTIAVSGQSDVVADSSTDTLTLVASTGMTITTNASNDTITFASSGGGSSDSFKTISVSGQSDVVADSSTDTLTLVAGNNMTITTNASGDEISFAASGGAGSGISEEQAIAFAIVYG